MAERNPLSLVELLSVPEYFCELLSSLKSNVLPKTDSNSQSRFSKKRRKISVETVQFLVEKDENLISAVLVYLKHNVREYSFLPGWRHLINKLQDKESSDFVKWLMCEVLHLVVPLSCHVKMTIFDQIQPNHALDMRLKYQTVLQQIIGQLSQSVANFPASNRTVFKSIGGVYCRTVADATVLSWFGDLERNSIAMCKVAQAISTGMPVLISGCVGSGKTALIKGVAANVGRLRPPELIFIQCDELMDVKALMGYYQCTEVPGQFIWKPGPLVTAAKLGSWIVFEELDKAPSEVIGILCSLIDYNKVAVSGRSPIYVNSEFRLFATSNSDTEFHLPQKMMSFGSKPLLRVHLPPWTDTDRCQLIASRYPSLNTVAVRLCETFEVLKHVGSRLLDTRDLLKWCNRLNLLSSSEMNDPARVFSEAFDCFCAHATSNVVCMNLANLVASKLNINNDQVIFLVDKYNPLVDLMKNQVKIGRITLQRQQNVNLNVRRRPDFELAMTRSARILLEKVAACVYYNEACLLVGETGCGKTSTVQLLAQYTGNNLTVLNMNQQSDASDLLGGFKPVDLKHLLRPLKDAFLDTFERQFSMNENSKYIQHIENCFISGRWNELLELMSHVIKKQMAPTAATESSNNNGATKLTKKQRKRKSEMQVNSNVWSTLAIRITRCSNVVKHASAGLGFAFVEGPLVDAIRCGTWLLLDEINLACAETLSCLHNLLDLSNSSKIVFAENGSLDVIEVHNNFRVFACMNPATDVGKRDLSVSLRSRFTEIFCFEPTEFHELRTLVQFYVGRLSLSVEQLDRIVKFYIAVRKLAFDLSSDAYGHKPHYCLRTLCRALKYAAQNTFNNPRRSLYESVCLSFLSELNAISYERVLKLVGSEIVGEQKALNGLISQPIMCSKASTSKQICGYWISLGPNDSVTDALYTLTPTVQRNLRDVVRVSSAGFPLLLQGETAVGKTSLVRYLAQLTGYHCERINNHEHTDLQEYVGGYSATETGQLKFIDGPLVSAMRKGDWVILDELNLAPPDVLEALNRLLDDNRELLIAETGELVKAHSSFRLFATQNPPGLYGGRKRLSRAFRSRFVELHFSELSDVELETILQKRCLLPPSYAKKMISVMKHLQIYRSTIGVFAGKEGHMTLRDLFRWGERYRLKECAEKSFNDWEQYLADQGYFLLGCRSRRREDQHAVTTALKTCFQRSVDIDRLFAVDSPYAPLDFSLVVPGFDHIFWTQDMRRIAVLVGQALLFNEPVVLVGETGCGKTSLCQLLAKLKQTCLHILNCHMTTEAADFLGRLRPSTSHADGSLFAWVNGPLVTAMLSGDWLLIDEISLADDSVLERLNSVLESDRLLTVSEGGLGESSCVVQAKQGFQLLATMNPGGDYGKRELSKALRSRFTEIWCTADHSVEDIISITEHNVNKNVKLKTTFDIDHDQYSGLGTAIAQFLLWFEQESTTAGKKLGTSLRDVLAWTTFVNVSSKIMSSDAAFIHGACLLILDGLDSSWQVDAITAEKVRRRAISFLCNCLTNGQSLKNEFVSLSDYSSVDFGVDSGLFGINPFYIPIGSFTKERKDYSLTSSNGVARNAFRVLRALTLKRPILLEGMPGVGKSSLVQAIADAAGFKLTRINLSEQTELADLFGCDLPCLDSDGNQKFAWFDGPLLKALKDGDWILLDEMNLATQSVLEGLNACLDHRGELFIPELAQTFTVRRGVSHFFATQNPYGQGDQRKALPRSFLNRFTIVHLSALDGDDLMRILCSLYPDFDRLIIQKMVTFNEKVHKAICVDRSFGQIGGPFEFNLRDLMRWMSLLQTEQSSASCYTPEIFIPLLYQERMRTDSDRIKIGDIANDVFSCRQLSKASWSSVHSKWVQFGDVFLPRSDIIPEVIESSVANLKLLPCQVEKLRSLGHCINMNWLAILVGPSTSGKTSLIRLLASLLGKRLSSVQLSNECDAAELLGCFEQLTWKSRVNVVLGRVSDFIPSEMQKCLVSNDQETCSMLFDIKSDIGRAIDNIQITDDQLIALLQRIVVWYSERVVKEPMDELLVSVMQQVKIVLKSNRQDTDSIQFHWINSALVDAMINGDWLILEDVNLCSAAVLDRLNAALEPGGSLAIPERGFVDGRPVVYKPHANFRIFFTMNAQFGSISRAMRNRGVEICLAESDLWSVDDQWIDSVLESKRLAKPSTASIEMLSSNPSKIIQMACAEKGVDTDDLKFLNSFENSLASALSDSERYSAVSRCRLIMEKIDTCDLQYATLLLCQLFLTLNKHEFTMVKAILWPLFDKKKKWKVFFSSVTDYISTSLNEAPECSQSCSHGLVMESGFQPMDPRTNAQLWEKMESTRSPSELSEESLNAALVKLIVLMDLYHARAISAIGSPLKNGELALKNKLESDHLAHVCFLQIAQLYRAFLSSFKMSSSPVLKPIAHQELNGVVQSMVALRAFLRVVSEPCSNLLSPSFPDLRLVWQLLQDTVLIADPDQFFVHTTEQIIRPIIHSLTNQLGCDRQAKLQYYNAMGSIGHIKAPTPECFQEYCNVHSTMRLLDSMIVSIGTQHPIFQASSILKWLDLRSRFVASLVSADGFSVGNQFCDSISEELQLSTEFNPNVMVMDDFVITVMLPLKSFVASSQWLKTGKLLPLSEGCPLWTTVSADMKVGLSTANQQLHSLLYFLTRNALCYRDPLKDVNDQNRMGQLFFQQFFSVYCDNIWRKINQSHSLWEADRWEKITEQSSKMLWGGFEAVVDCSSDLWNDLVRSLSSLAQIDDIDSTFEMSTNELPSVLTRLGYKLCTMVTPQINSIDIVVETQIQRTILTFQKEHIEQELNVWRQWQFNTTGQKVLIDYVYLDALQSVRRNICHVLESLEEQHAYRPIISMFENLTSDLHAFNSFTSVSLKSVVDKWNNVDNLSTTELNSLKAKCNSLIKSVMQFEDKLFATYHAYADVFSPYLLGVRSQVLGLSIIAQLVENIIAKKSTGNSSLFITFPYKFVRLADVQEILHGNDLTLRTRILTLLSNQLQCSWDWITSKQKVESATMLITNLASLYTKHLESAEADDQYFVIKARRSNMTAEEIEEDEIKKLFPNYELPFAANDPDYHIKMAQEREKAEMDKKSSFGFDESMLHYPISSLVKLVENVPSTHEWQELLVEAYTMGHSSKTNTSDQLGSCGTIELDRSTMGMHIIALSSKSRLSLKESVNNIYFDSDHLACQELKDGLLKLRCHVLELLEQWPEQIALLNLKDEVDRVIGVPVDSSIMALASRVENLLEFCGLWERIAARQVSIAVEMELFQNLLMKWRKKELDSFSQLLDNTDLGLANRGLLTGLRWWNLMVTDGQNDVELIQSAVQLMETSTLGEFRTRLTVLRIACKSFGQSCTSHLKNIVSFFSLFIDSVEKKIESFKTPLSVKLKQVTKILSYSGKSWRSIKLATQRAHKQLYRLVKDYKDLLSEAVATVLSDAKLELPNFHEMPLTLSTPSTFSPCDKQPVDVQMATEFVENISHGHRLAQLVNTISRDLNTTLVDHLSNLDSDSTEFVGHFSKQIPYSDADDDEISQKKCRKELNMRSTSFLSFLKELRLAGFSPRHGLKLTGHGSDFDDRLMQLKTVNLFDILKVEDVLWLSNENDWHSSYFANVYALRSLKIVSQKPHIQVSNQVSQRCIGFAYAIMNEVLSQRTTITDLVNSFKLVQKLRYSIECMHSDVGSGDLTDQKVSSDLTMVVESCATDIISPLEQIVVLSSCSPLPGANELTANLTKIVESIRFEMKALIDKDWNYSLYTSRSELNEQLQHAQTIQRTVDDLNSIADSAVSFLRDSIVSSANTLKTTFSNSSTLRANSELCQLISGSGELQTLTEKVVKNILLKTQKLTKLVLSTEENPSLKDLLMNCGAIGKLFACDETIISIEQFVSHLANSKQCDQTTAYMFNIVKAFSNCYFQLFKYVFLWLIKCHLSLCRTTFSLLQLISIVLSKGFVNSPPQKQESGKAGQEQKFGDDVDAAGLGDGEGEKDVSDQIEDESQVEDLKNKNETEQDSNEMDKPKDDDKSTPIDMDDDFDAKVEDVDSNNEESDNNESEDDKKEENETDLGMDKVDRPEEEQLDPKLWNPPKSNEDDENQDIDDKSAAPQDQQDNQLAAAERGDDAKDSDLHPNEDEQKDLESDTEQEDAKDDMENINLDDLNMDDGDDNDDGAEDTGSLNGDVGDDEDGDEVDENVEPLDENDDLLDEEGIETAKGLEDMRPTEKSSASSGGLGESKNDDVKEEGSAAESAVDNPVKEVSSAADKSEEPEAEGMEVGDEDEKVDDKLNEQEEQSANNSKDDRSRNRGQSSVSSKPQKQPTTDKNDHAPEPTKAQELDKSTLADTSETNELKEKSQLIRNNQSDDNAGDMDDTGKWGHSGGLDKGQGALLWDAADLTLAQRQARDFEKENDSLLYDKFVADSTQEQSKAMEVDATTELNDGEVPENATNDVMEVDDQLMTEPIASIDRTSVIHTVLDYYQQASKTQDLLFEQMQDLTQEADPDDIEQAVQLWNLLRSMTYSLSAQLCESLRLVLEPTAASRMSGDYRSGKRLNVRRLLSYLASGFRKNRIWLRRTKKAKREYQILLAIDDSASMLDNHGKQLALESVCLLWNALDQLEVGQLGVCKFGSVPTLLHSLDSTRTERRGATVLSHLAFDQSKTDMAKLLTFSSKYLGSATSDSTKLEMSQLLIIVSDGRGIFSEGTEPVLKAIRELHSQRIFIVFLVLDNNKENKNSILDMKMPIFSEDGKVTIRSYMDFFPFPFYVVLRESSALPAIMGDALRQWFELIVSELC